MNQTMTITMRGTRGSVPTANPDYQIYGGSTSCVSVSCGDTLLFLDAGSGIVGAPVPDNHMVSILLTHLHLDHVIGLPFYHGLFQKGTTVAIYGKERSGKTIQDALQSLFSPPYWPVGLKDFAADVSVHSIEDHFTIGCLSVLAMEGSHPGGSTIYRVSHGAKSFVYATDFEHNDVVTAELMRFSKDADLLIYDAQYTKEEYPAHFGFGHSTPEEGIRLAEAANVGRILFTHHAPGHSDAMMQTWEAQVATQHPFAAFAKAGMEVVL